MEENCILIENGLGTDSGTYVAYWAENPDSTTVVCVFGYCSANHSRKTLSEMVAVVRRFHPNIPIYRNGKLVK